MYNWRSTIRFIPTRLLSSSLLAGGFSIARFLWPKELLLLTIFLFIPHIGYTNSDFPHTAKQHKNIHVSHIILIYSKESLLQTKIAEKIASMLATYKQIKLLKITTQRFPLAIRPKADLIIAIGQDAIEKSAEYYSKMKKLLIVSHPDQAHTLNEINSKYNNILYMTQPYCRQLKFIKLINRQWHRISYLTSKNHQADDYALKKCARKNNIELYKVNIGAPRYLINRVRNALSHSDLLLALPDKNIYNSETAKSILLTSYRYRKPLIGFSRNFVNAGALAAIYSKPGSIAKSAVTIIKKFLHKKYPYRNKIHYPDDFNISINKQVFRALDIDIPDTSDLKYKIFKSEDKQTERLK